MNRKKPNRLVEFLNGKGFYIILILCVAAVGISGYVLFFSGNSQDDGTLMSVPSTLPSASPTAPTVRASSEPLTTAIPGGAVREPEVVMSVPSAAPSSDPSPQAAPSSADEPSGAVEVAGEANLDGGKEGGTDAPRAAFYVWPINGEVRNPFSVDELVFSNTMEDWRVHTGADISGSLGTLVSAIGAGVVEDVYFDEMMGNTVLINHGGETYSVYKNLAEKLNVSIGDVVAAGDVIGAIGYSAEAEIADTPHLHLEVIRAGAQIDPLDILP